MLGPPRRPGDQSLGGPAGPVPRPDAKQMFVGRTDSCGVPGAFPRPDPLPFTPPYGVPGQARRV